MENKQQMEKIKNVIEKLIKQNILLSSDFKFKEFLKDYIIFEYNNKCISSQRLNVFYKISMKLNLDYVVSVRDNKINIMFY